MVPFSVTLTPKLHFKDRHSRAASATAELLVFYSCRDGRKLLVQDMRRVMYDVADGLIVGKIREFWKRLGVYGTRIRAPTTTAEG